ncbi:YwgA family protein [Virgibacillus sp. MSJ-26]|uniref:YwgA family protein n=1 Tax=Virgibacillus sp. MSJ-26 TaxID=2841522 RepID=UPI001C1065BE|nr:YwgA family protein [Virgibacillus sp. MSJ-26]MBU5465228.1 YwgA family protein [Virgibacillus sp. MSJ-26]
MLTDHAKLLRFFAEMKKVTGRKKLQKMIFILQACGVPFQEKYQFHIYGPYSEELTLRMEELCNLGFIHEEKEEKSNYAQYIYEITDEGIDFLYQIQPDMPDFANKAKLLQQESSRFLELTATMLFFRDLTKQEVEKKVHDVKPKQNYSATEMDRAWSLIESISHHQLPDNKQMH